jgi:hypothetical protein
MLSFTLPQLCLGPLQLACSLELQICVAFHSGYLLDHWKPVSGLAAILELVAEEASQWRHTHLTTTHITTQ